MKSLTFKPTKTSAPNHQPHLQVGLDIAKRSQQWQAKKQIRLDLERKK